MRTSLAAFSDAFSVGLREATASSTRASASAKVTGSSGAPRRWMRLGIRRHGPFEVEDLLGEAGGGALARTAVPKLGDLPGPALTEQRSLRGGEHVLAPRARDDIRPLLDGDRTLGRLPERDARDAEHGRLLLHPAGVRQNERGAGEEPEEVEVAERWLQLDPRPVDPVPKPEGADPRVGARVERENDRDLGRDLLRRLEETREDPLVVDVLWAVEREKGVWRGDAETLGRAAGARLVGRAQKCVDHGVPHEFDALIPDPLGDEVFACVAARREEVGGEGGAEATVDLLGNEEVVTAEAGLDVGDRVVLLRGDEGARERRVDVADHDHDRGVEAPEFRLEGGHNPRRLVGVRPRAHTEVGIGLGQAELGEEDVRELGVVVLAGV